MPIIADIGLKSLHSHFTHLFHVQEQDLLEEAGHEQRHHGQVHAEGKVAEQAGQQRHGGEDGAPRGSGPFPVQAFVVRVQVGHQVGALVGRDPARLLRRVHAHKVEHQQPEEHEEGWKRGHDQILILCSTFETLFTLCSTFEAKM